MFEIDLLKGEGRPVKSQPWAVALVTAPFLIPLVTTILLVSFYIADGITIRNMDEQMTRADAKLKTLLSTRGDRDKAQIQLDSAAKCSIEIAGAVKNHVQWSDVIHEISDTLPASVVVYKFSASREKQAPRPDKSGKPQIGYKFTIMIGAYDVGEAGGGSIGKFIEAMKSSKVLGQRIESIRPVSNQNGSFNGRDVAVFDIECVIKGIQ
jgi:hypothetical protein